MPNESTDALLDRLSARQRDVLELLARGLTNEDIAGVLGLAHGTVRTHVSAVLRVLQVGNRTEAASALRAAERSREDAVFERPALAVLPLDTEHVSDPSARAFATGIPDDLIRLFSRWAWFPVIARSSSLDSGRVAGGAREVGRSLGAKYLVGGRAHQFGDRIAVQIHLEDAERETTVWAERYDVELAALFEVHHEVSETIVARLYPRLIEAVSLAVEVPGRSLPAWQVAQMGLVEYAQRSRAANARAAELFDRAIAQDGELLLAHFGRGLTLYQDALNDWKAGDPTRRALEATTERCMELAPARAEPRFLRGRLEMARGALSAAVPWFREATRINPSFAEAYAALAQARLLTEDQAEGLALMERAARLSPRAYVAGLACAQFSAGRYEEALRSAESALETHPGYTFARALACASAAQLGDDALARRLLEAIRRAEPGFKTDYIRKMFARQSPSAVDRLVDAIARIQ